jgi:hypothetical protein
LATLIQAYAIYGPRVDLTKAASVKHFMKLLTKRTTLSEGVVRNVQECEVDLLIDLLMEGRPVHTGVAVFTPSIDSQGKLSVSVRVDKRITAALNAEGNFAGAVNNSANIGKTTTEIVELWNEDHPDDLIILTPEPEPQPF